MTAKAFIWYSGIIIIGGFAVWLLYEVAQWFLSI